MPAKRIFDVDFSRYNERGLHFRHTDNINFFLQALDYIGLPTVRPYKSYFYYIFYDFVVSS